MIDKKEIRSVEISVEMRSGDKYNYWLGDWKDLDKHVHDIIDKFNDKEDTISLSKEMNPQQFIFLEKDDIRSISVDILNVDRNKPKTL